MNHLTTLTCLLTLTGGANAAILNASFEAAGATGATLGSFPDFLINSTLPSWTSISLAADLHDASSATAPYVGADDGDSYVGFTTNQHGISQMLTGLVAGQSYDLTFAQSGGMVLNGTNYVFVSAAGSAASVAVFDSAQTFASLDVLTTAGSLGSSSFTFSTPTVPASSTTPFTPTWSTESFTFIAPSDGDVTLYVNLGATGGDGQVLYDNFTLTPTPTVGAVPEPAQPALLGIGILAIFARRRR